MNWDRKYGNIGGIVNLVLEDENKFGFEYVKFVVFVRYLSRVV